MSASPVASVDSTNTTNRSAENAADTSMSESCSEEKYEFNAPKFHDFERLSSDSSKVADKWFGERGPSMPLTPSIQD